MQVGWGKGLGQKDYKRDWDWQSGLTKVPIDNINQKNLRTFCDGCVIDRATCPRAMIEDLDRMLPGSSVYDSRAPNGGPPKLDNGRPGPGGPGPPPPQSGMNPHSQARPSGSQDSLTASLHQLRQEVRGFLF